MISKKYSEFLPSMQSAQDLVARVDKLSDDIDLLKSRIESEVRIVCYVASVRREAVQLPDSSPIQFCTAFRDFAFLIGKWYSKYMILG